MDTSPVIYDLQREDNRTEQEQIDHTCFRKYQRTYSGKIFFIFSPQQLLALSYFYLVFGAVLVFTHTITDLPEKTGQRVLKIGAFLVFCGWTTFIFVIETVKIRMRHQYLQELVRRKPTFVDVSVPPLYQKEWLSAMLLPAIERGWQPSKTTSPPFRPYQEDLVAPPEPSVDRDLPRPSSSRRRRNRKKKNIQAIVEQVLEFGHPLEEPILESEDITESDLQEGQFGTENTPSGEVEDFNLSTDEEENLPLDEPTSQSEEFNVSSQQSEDLNLPSIQQDESVLPLEQSDASKSLEQSGSTHIPLHQLEDSSTSHDDSNLRQLQNIPSGQSEGLDESSSLTKNSNLSYVQTEDDQSRETSPPDNLNKAPQDNASVPGSKKRRKRNRNRKKKKNQGQSIQAGVQSEDLNLSSLQPSDRDQILEDPEGLLVSCSDPEDSIHEDSTITSERPDESIIATGQPEDVSLYSEDPLPSDGMVVPEQISEEPEEAVLAASGGEPEDSAISGESGSSNTGDPENTNKTTDENPPEDTQGDWLPSRPKRKWNTIRKE